MHEKKINLTEKPDAGIWNYHPVLPIEQGGIFRNIWNPLFVSKNVFLSWFGIYIRGIFLAIITVLWLTILPATEDINKGNSIWLAQIFVVNLMLMLLWAGSLHLYLHRYNRQGTFLKFDPKPMQKGPQFTFGDQVYDNMFWTLIFSVPIWTFYETSLLWAHALDLIPPHTWEGGPLWFILLFILIPYVDSSHFYLTHRFLHWKWVYKHVHSVHHRNVNVGPWSGMSMHPVESAIFLSPVLIHLFLPSHPLHIVFHISWLAIGPVGTHCGFAALSNFGKQYPCLGDFFHVLHHKYFECNYGNSEVPLDKLSGCFHDGTIEGTACIQKRLNNISN